MDGITNYTYFEINLIHTFNNIMNNTLLAVVMIIS